MRVGIDMVQNSRVTTDIIDRVFTNSEKLLNKPASVFALKEAVMKTLGRKIPWEEIVVSYINDMPVVNYKDHTFSCSVSHENGMTIAIVILN